MRYSILLFALLLEGCASLAKIPSGETPAGRKASVIYVGMTFRAAEEKLNARGARPGLWAVLLTREAARAGKELHLYILPNHVCFHIVSRPGKTERIVESISVSTYRPKSFESKTDPEVLKWDRSFHRRASYDLEEEPNPSLE